MIINREFSPDQVASFQFMRMRKGNKGNRFHLKRAHDWFQFKRAHGKVRFHCFSEKKKATKSNLECFPKREKTTNFLKFNFLILAVLMATKGNIKQLGGKDLLDSIIRIFKKCSCSLYPNLLSTFKKKFPASSWER